MANRVLLGNRATGGYGLYVSKANSNVLDCAPKDLLFDSRGKSSGTGQVYAGGGPLNISSGTGGQNFLTTGTKDNLGYIPLAICNEDFAGEYRAGYTVGWPEPLINVIYQSRVDIMKTTSEKIEPIYIDYSTGTYIYNDRRNTQEAYFGGDQSCTNLHFVILKVPCAYGYMTSTYF